MRFAPPVKKVDFGLTFVRSVAEPPGFRPARAGVTSKFRSRSGSLARTVTSATALPTLWTVTSWAPEKTPRDVWGTTSEVSCTKGATATWPSSTVIALASEAARTAMPKG